MFRQNYKTANLSYLKMHLYQFLSDLFIYIAQQKATLKRSVMIFLFWIVDFTTNKWVWNSVDRLLCSWQSNHSWWWGFKIYSSNHSKRVFPKLNLNRIKLIKLISMTLGIVNIHLCMTSCHANPAATHAPCPACPSGHPSPLPCTPPRGQNYWHTLVKTLPCRNFVAGGNNWFWC